MSIKISLSFLKTIGLAALLFSASSIPVSTNSMDIKYAREMIFPSKSGHDLPRENPPFGASKQIEELTDRGLFNLAEGLVTPLSRIANIVLNLAVDQQGHRSIPIIPEKSSVPMMSEHEHGVDGTEGIEKKSSVKVPEKLEFKPKKFHCHPIEDIFIQDVAKKVPAYICTLGSRQFILSSERFIADYKYHLDITVDETTFHHLLIPDQTSMGNSVANVIPVTLTQRQGEEFYGVKTT